MKFSELVALEKEATEGPWIKEEYDYNDGTGPRISALGPITFWASHADDSSLEIPDADAKFIAASRTLMPKLLDVARAAKMVCLISKREQWEAIEQLNKMLEELEKE